MEKIYKKIGKRYKEVEQRLNLDQEIVLGCAFRYALGRSTYVVSSICSELIRLEPILNNSFKYRLAKEIAEYQAEYGKAGMDFDNEEWSYIKWLFTSERRVIVEANRYNTDIWEEVEAVEGEDGVYYTTNGKSTYYHKVRNVRRKTN
jgi:hypothetical protein